MFCYFYFLFKVKVAVQEVHTTLPVGSVIQGRYVIEALLGQGGFGAVYLVRDQRVRGNLFALKEIIDPDEKDRNRFFFEGEVLKQHDHPALPRVYRVFEQTELQRVYMLMDYIEGPNLEQLRGQRPDSRFSLEQVYSILAPVANVLTYLHSQQPPILHRDIKPANIIIPISGAGTVLVDFGIAKAYDEDTTTTAVRHCSPGYGAPEQYGRGTNIATDIYGLAATCYALLSGVVPIDALTRMTNIGTREFDPLTPLDELVPTLPAHVAHAVHQALAIKSTARFASVTQFWAAFTKPPAGTSYDTEKIIEQLPFPAEPLYALPQKARPSVIVRPIHEPVQPTSQAASTRKRRRTLPLLLLFLACLLLISGSLSTLWYLQHHGSLLPIGKQFTQPTSTSGASTVIGSTPPQVTAIPTKHPITPTKTSVVSGHPTATVAAGSTPISQPTTVPVIQPTATPQPPATPTPAPPPPTPTPAPHVFPHLVSSYSGVVDDTTANPDIKASMFLSSVKQNQGTISGFFTVTQPLVGSNSFTGSVTTNRHIQFTVSSYNGNAPLLFWGTVQGNGNMSGSYCSIDTTGHCNANVGAAGVWSICPCSSASIVMSMRIQSCQ